MGQMQVTICPPFPPVSAGSPNEAQIILEVDAAVDHARLIVPASIAELGQPGGLSATDTDSTKVPERKPSLGSKSSKFGALDLSL